MPKLTISIPKLRNNLRVLQQLCAHRQIVFVAKCLRSDEEFLRAFAPWKEGVKIIADSYISHLAKLDKLAAKKGLKRMLLRPECIKNTSKVVAGCEIAAASEYQYLKALNIAAKAAKKRLEIMLMVDLGDLREGYFYPEKLFKIIKKFPKLKRLKLRSLGVNLTCLNGVLPSEENLSQLAAYAAKASVLLGYKVLASGGNSSSLGLIQSAKMPAGIDELRLGDSILTGRDCSDFSLVAGCVDDAFCLSARVIELKTKPSMPVGKRALDAFGKEVSVQDEGPMRRAILQCGKASCEPGAMRLAPKFSALKILGASSDHLVLNASQMPTLRLNQAVKFHLEYSAILRAFSGCEMQIIYKGRS